MGPNDSKKRDAPRSPPESSQGSLARGSMLLTAEARASSFEEPGSGTIVAEPLGVRLPRPAAFAPCPSTQSTPP